MGKPPVEEVDREGRPFHWSFTPSQGVAVPIEGMENSTVEEKLSGNTIDHTWKRAGWNTHAHGVLSKDGKTLRYTEQGTDNQGRPVHTVLIFEIQ